ncbi:MAG: hypothetical protein LUO93_02465 [Methanomicrobiales archaeon]|nr:hypothetical protein [Methanomicrobiales archaeon]
MPIIPVFKIQIASVETGVVASSFGGGLLEKNLTDALIEELRKERIGIMSSRSAIEAAVARSVQRACVELKARTRGVVEERFTKRSLPPDVPTETA